MPSGRSSGKWCDRLEGEELSETRKSLTGLLGFGMFWTAVIVASVFFAHEALTDIASRPPEDVNQPRALWLALHALTAMPLLVIAPLQFIAALRKARPAVHRWLGRVFLGASIAGALSAVYLSVGYFLEAARIPLFAFGLLWAAFASIAWLAAAKGDFQVHRAFAIRTFGLAFAFVWVRSMRIVEEPVFGFITDELMQDLTREWMSFIVPLLVVEVWLSWWPAAKRVMNRPWRRSGASDTGAHPKGASRD